MDILLQETGSHEQLATFLRDNDLPLDGHFGAGGEVIVPEPDADSTVEYFRRRGLQVVTGAHNALDYPGGSYSDDYSNDYD